MTWDFFFFSYKILCRLSSRILAAFCLLFSVESLSADLSEPKESLLSMVGERMRKMVGRRKREEF